MSPFVVKIGNGYFIAADGKVLLEVPVSHDRARSMDALACLLATYYVFNVKWCPHLVPTYLFLQCELLDKKDMECEDNKALKTFLGVYKDEWKEQHGDTQSD